MIFAPPPSDYVSPWNSRFAGSFSFFTSVSVAPLSRRSVAAEAAFSSARTISSVMSEICSISSASGGCSGFPLPRLATILLEELRTDRENHTGSLTYDSFCNTAHKKVRQPTPTVSGHDCHIDLEFLRHALYYLGWFTRLYDDLIRSVI